MSGMRRAVPWALLGLLTAGTAAGIALGVADRPSQTAAQWVASAFATTAQAGTARFTFSLVLTHSNSAAFTEARGSGQVDFVSGDLTATERAFGSNVTTHTIAIGHTEYVGLDAELHARWVKLPLPHEPQSSLGLAGVLGGAVPFLGLSGYEPVVAVDDVGPASIGTTETTRYLVSSAPPPLCPGHHKHGSTLTSKQLPTTVWLDHSGRIVQIRSRIQETFGPLPAGTDPAFGNLTNRLRVDSASTLHFSDFGLPVAISAPSTGRILSRGVSIGTAESRRCR
jgi:hypothetical protein